MKKYANNKNGKVAIIIYDNAAGLCRRTIGYRMVVFKYEGDNVNYPFVMLHNSFYETHSEIKLIVPNTNLTEEEVDYELGIHDCGQNPYCDRYRSCGLNEKPLPSEDKIKELITIGTERLLKNGHDMEFITRYFNERYKNIQ